MKCSGVLGTFDRLYLELLVICLHVCFVLLSRCTFLEGVGLEGLDTVSSFAATPAGLFFSFLKVFLGNSVLELAL